MAERKKETSENIVPAITDIEMERLRRDIYRSDVEKLSLFTRMLRQNALFKKAKIIHK
jgi:hypothetical protein